MAEQYVHGLPEASGTFTVNFDPDDTALSWLLEQVPDLMPVDINTGDRPNPAAAFMTELRIRAGDDEWVLPVDHVDLFPGTNRVRVWVRRPALEEEHDG